MSLSPRSQFPRHRVGFSASFHVAAGFRLARRAATGCRPLRTPTLCRQRVAAEPHTDGRRHGQLPSSHDEAAAGFWPPGTIILHRRRRHAPPAFRRQRRPRSALTRSSVFDWLTSQATIIRAVVVDYRFSPPFISSAGSRRSCRLRPHYSISRARCQIGLPTRTLLLPF